MDISIKISSLPIYVRLAVPKQLHVIMNVFYVKRITPLLVESPTATYTHRYTHIHLTLQPKCSLLNGLQ